VSPLNFLHVENLVVRHQDLYIQVGTLINKSKSVLKRLF